MRRTRGQHAPEERREHRKELGLEEANRYTGHCRHSAAIAVEGANVAAERIFRMDVSVSLRRRRKHQSIGFAKDFNETTLLEEEKAVPCTAPRDPTDTTRRRSRNRTTGRKLMPSITEESGSAILHKERC